MASPQVDLHPLGFVVTIDGRAWPQTLPGRVLIFHSRTDARRYANAIEANDMKACHEIIEARGRWYEVAA